MIDIIEIRKYIIEKVDLEFQLKQYVSAMKAILIKLLNDVQTGNLDNESKKVLEDNMVKLIKGKHDYTKSGEQKRLFSALKLPSAVNESYINEVISFVDVKKSKQPIMFADSSADNFFYKLSKKLKNFLDKDLPAKTLKKVTIGLAAAAIFLAFSIASISLYKKLTRDKQFRNIVDNDINPIVLDLAKAIVRGRVSNINVIDSAMQEVAQGVIRKHLLKRV